MISKESHHCHVLPSDKSLAKFDLAVKYVSINPVFSLEQKYNELQSYDDASYQVSSKSAHSFLERFLSVYTIYGHYSHLGYVTSIMFMIFSSPSAHKVSL